MATGGASTTSSKSNMLAEMFRPPFEIMSRLPWDSARQEGRDKEKWLIVNVQDPSVFDCQALNRDIWKNKEIMECIREHFIFLQYIKNDPRGESYINYYFQVSVDIPDAYPHIAIVDPRTGEQVKVWSGTPIPKANDFLMQLYEFLDRYSLKTGTRNPVAKRKPEPRKDLEKMTEEEQLEMALANSLENGSGIPQPDADPDALTKSEIMGKGKAPAGDLIDLTDTPMETEPNGSHEEEASAFSQISSNVPHTEPPADPATTTRIQFRYSGGRQVRRFALSDSVRRIYEWLKASPIDGKNGIEFDLIFMGKNLIGFVDETIEQAGLKNGSVMVEFLGQDEE
jgi:UBX domain-containing protein 7